MGTARIFCGLAESPSSHLNVDSSLCVENFRIIFTFKMVTLSARVRVSCTTSALSLIHHLSVESTHVPEPVPGPVGWRKQNKKKTWFLPWGCL